MCANLSSRLRHARAGKLTLAVGVCLYASQLIVGQLIVSPAAAAPVASPTQSPATVGTVASARTVAAVGTVAAAGTVATVGTVAAAGIVSRELPDAPVRVRLGLSASTRSTPWGSPVMLTARVTDPRTGQAVTGGNIRFQAWRKGAWRTWQTRLVVNGVATHKATPRVTGNFRLLYSGLEGTYWWTASSSIRVNVVASRARVISESRKYLGARYQYGATGPRAFDCSGFTQHVYRNATGRELPHKANLQQRYGKAIARTQAKPGDLIIFRSGSYGTHAGIYAGGGYMYDSPGPGETVGKHKIWSSNYVVRRLV